MHACYIGHREYTSPDCTLTIGLTDFITIHLCFTCYFGLIVVYIFHMLTCYMHVHFLLYSYTFTRRSDSLDLYIQILDVLFPWSGVRWDQICCEEQEFLSTHYGILAFFYSCFCSILYSCYYSLIHVYQTRLLFLFLFHVLWCVDIYMQYYSNHDLS